MKRRFEPIQVDLTRGWPVALHRNGNTHRVQHLIDYWVVEGRWWAEEERRVYFRVLTTGGTMDIFRRGNEAHSDAGTWMLSKVLD